MAASAKSQSTIKPTPIAELRPTQPRILIEAASRGVIQVELVGRNYDLRPPKAAFSLRIAQRAQNADENIEILLDLLTGWMTAAFGKKVAGQIMDRLDDPEDELDFPHLMELLQKVVELGVNPTS